MLSSMKFSEKLEHQSWSECPCKIFIYVFCRNFYIWVERYYEHEKDPWFAILQKPLADLWITALWVDAYYLKMWCRLVKTYNHARFILETIGWLQSCYPKSICLPMLTEGCDKLNLSVYIPVHVILVSVLTQFASTKMLIIHNAYYHKTQTCTQGTCEPLLLFEN